MELKPDNENDELPFIRIAVAAANVVELLLKQKKHDAADDKRHRNAAHECSEHLTGKLRIG